MTLFYINELLDQGVNFFRSVDVWIVLVVFVASDPLAEGRRADVRPIFLVELFAGDGVRHDTRLDCSTVGQ